MQKYRFDVIEDAMPNGSIPCYAQWMGGKTLSGVRNCPLGNTEYTVTAYVTGEPDTYFSTPAIAKIKGKRIKGWIGCGEAGFQFNPNHF